MKQSPIQELRASLEYAWSTTLWVFRGPWLLRVRGLEVYRGATLGPPRWDLWLDDTGSLNVEAGRCCMIVSRSWRT